MYNGLEPHQRDHIAALIMFHCGLYRTFGTKECIRQLGFIHMNAWDKAAQEKVVAICMSLWRRGIANFTRAYGPARIYRSRETHARRHVHGESFARALFQDAEQTETNHSEQVLKYGVVFHDDHDRDKDNALRIFALQWPIALHGWCWVKSILHLLT